MNYNKVVLVGRITKDPELRQTSQNIPYTLFSLAVNRKYSQGDNKQVDFINCVAWDKKATFLSQYISKGALLLVEGRIQVRSYENNEGLKQIVTEIICDDIQPLESRASRSNKDSLESTYQPYIPQSNNKVVEEEETDLSTFTREDAPF